MWYETEKKAEEACKRKEKEFNCEFYVLKDSDKNDCYWAQRRKSLENV